MVLVLEQEQKLEIRAQQLRAENEAIERKIQQQRRQHIKAQVSITLIHTAFVLLLLPIFFV